MTLRKPVMFRIKVEDDLRCRFRGAAWRSHHTPAQVMRMLMERYVEQEVNPHVLDLTVWSNSVNIAVAETLHVMPRKPPIFVYEDDDEVTVARKEGWASPGFGRW